MFSDSIFNKWTSGSLRYEKSQRKRLENMRYRIGTHLSNRVIDKPYDGV